MPSISPQDEQVSIAQHHNHHKVVSISNVKEGGFVAGVSAASINCRTETTATTTTTTTSITGMDNDGGDDGMGILKFQQEKKSLSRNLQEDEEVIFEKDNHNNNSNEYGDDDNDNDDHFLFLMNNGGAAAGENRSVSSTTPTANSWSVMDEEGTSCGNHQHHHHLHHLGTEESQQQQRQEPQQQLDQRKEGDAQEKEEEEDRKPAAIDLSLSPEQHTPDSKGSRIKDIPTNSASWETPTSAMAIAPSTTFSSAESRSKYLTPPSFRSGPPPLISFDLQQSLAALNQNKLGSSSPEKRRKSSMQNHGKSIHSTQTPSTPQQTNQEHHKNSKDNGAAGTTTMTSSSTATAPLHQQPTSPARSTTNILLSFSSTTTPSSDSHGKAPAQKPAAIQSPLRTSAHGRPGLRGGLERQEGNLHINKMNNTSILKEPPPGSLEPSPQHHNNNSNKKLPPPSPPFMDPTEPLHVPDSTLKALYQHPGPRMAKPAGLSGTFKKVDNSHDDDFRHSHHSQHQVPSSMALQRQLGTLHISGDSSAQAQLPQQQQQQYGFAGKIMNAGMNNNKKMMPIQRMMRAAAHPHKKQSQPMPMPPNNSGNVNIARRPPFTVSQETIELAKGLNRMQREKDKQRMQERLELRRLKEQQQQLAQAQQRQEIAETGDINDDNGDFDEDDTFSGLNASKTLSDDLGDDSIIESQSFVLAKKVLESESRRASSDSVISSGRPRLAVGASSRPRRHSVIMERDLVSIASADPAFNAFISEPTTSSITGRSTPKTALLADKRRSFQRKRSKHVIENTAALKSFRSGISSVTIDTAVREATTILHQRPVAWSQGRSAFPREFSIGEINLDNPTSAHSSIGYNSASMRSILENSAHFRSMIADNVGETGGYRNYSPQLHPHPEGGSTVSGANISTNSLDATSTVTPPTREQFRDRQSSRRASASLPGGRRPSRRASLQSIRSGDDASQVSSIVSGGAMGMPRRTSRSSATSGAGLRRTAPLEQADGNDRVSSRRSSKSGDVGIPVPKRVDPSRIMVRLKKENEKKQSQLWDDILDDQNDIIMQLACQLSQKDNELQVLSQQLPDLCKLHEGSSAATTCISQTTSNTQTISNVNSPSHESQLSLQHMLLQDRMDFSSQPAKSAHSATTSQEDKALQLAIEESRREARRAPVKTDSDRALEVALAISRAEAEELDRQRHANPFFFEQGLPTSGVEREKKAPLAPLELNTVQGNDGEVAGTMEVATKLSRQEYEYEVSKRRQTARPGVPSVSSERNSGHSSSRVPKTSAHESTMDYSVSTQSLVMPSEMLDDDDSVRREPTGFEDEALALAMALSKLDEGSGTNGVTGGSARSINDLSQEESLAYVMELSRRTPGAHGSRVEPPAGRAPLATPTTQASCSSRARNPQLPPASPRHAPSTQSFTDYGAYQPVMAPPPQMYPGYHHPHHLPIPAPPYVHAYYPPNAGLPVIPSHFYPGYQPYPYYNYNRSMGFMPADRVVPPPQYWVAEDDEAMKVAMGESASYGGIVHEPPSVAGRMAGNGFPQQQHQQQPAPNCDDDDEALRLAMAISYEACYGAHGSRNSGPPATTVDDEDLALAIALSRRET